MFLGIHTEKKMIEILNDEILYFAVKEKSNLLAFRGDILASTSQFVHSN